MREWGQYGVWMLCKRIPLRKVQIGPAPERRCGRHPRQGDRESPHLRWSRLQLPRAWMRLRHSSGSGGGGRQRLIAVIHVHCRVGQRRLRRSASPTTPAATTCAPSGGAPSGASGPGSCARSHTCMHKRTDPPRSHHVCLDSIEFLDSDQISGVNDGAL